MATTVFNRQIVDDAWTLVQLAHDESPATFALPEAGGIFPLSIWAARKQEIISRYKRIGLWLDDAKEIETVADDLHYFRVIAIDLPDFADGRMHAAARLLRERYRYQGEVRAICSIEKSTQSLGTAAPRAALPVPLIDLNDSLRTAVADKVQAVETRLAEIAAGASPAVFASSLAARNLVLADIVVTSRLPVTIHTGSSDTDLLAGWTDKEIWAYIHLHQVPYGARRAAARQPVDRAPVALRLVQSCMARQ